MDRSNSFLDSSRKINLPSAGNISSDQGQRFQQPDGSIVHGDTKHNRSAMGEIIKASVNTLGWMTLIAGFLANLDNIVSVLLGAAAFAFGVYKALNEREAWLMKQIDRKERNERYKTKT